MLSATFFRARFSKLFYMIRMLQSPIPRSLPYLNALLAEHIICHVPEVRREWDVSYVPIKLLEPLRSRYDKICNRRNTEDKKVIYGRLKQLLHKEFNATLALRENAEDLVINHHRRPLIFTNSISEKNKLKKEWGSSKPKCVRIMTKHEGAHGINMQFECDAIVTRPHPGDIMEQMKGRIDRPGQKHTKLLLRIIYAAGTVEDVEAANVRVCGRFVRQYLNPLSEQFCQLALEGKAGELREGFDRKLRKENETNAKKGNKM
eukprot:jgi/Bigna1/141595/aug1.63_g16303